MNIYKVSDLSKLPDCIALSENGRCTRLKVYKCCGEKCSFKRTHKEELNSIQCANQRLASLNDSIQNYIAKKYYEGCMP